jgi:hypothetical protein
VKHVVVLPQQICAAVSKGKDFSSEKGTLFGICAYSDFIEFYFCIKLPKTDIF